MADDLRQVELRVEFARGEKVDLALGIGVRIRPAAKRERVIALAQHLPQLPRVLDRARHADALVAAEHDERRKTRSGARVRRTTGSTRVDASTSGTARCARAGTSLPRLMTRCRRLSSSSAPTALSVRKHERALPRQPPDGVIGVDPRIHALGRGELGARRPQFRREHRRTGVAAQTQDLID